MKNSWVVIGITVLILLASTATGATIATSSLDVSGLASQFSISQEADNRLNALYTAMLNNGLNDQQTKLMLSQILFETGMLTDVANESLMNRNNYAGLTVPGGAYASYNSVDDFMTSYIGFLSKGADPLDATSLTDFNNRLQQNHYYTENPTVYYNGLLSYYNLL